MSKTLNQWKPPHSDDKIIKYHINQLMGENFDRDDAEEIVKIALWMAYKKKEENPKFAIATYMVLLIKFVKNNLFLRRNKMTNFVPNTIADPKIFTEMIENKDICNKYLSILPSKERFVVENHIMHGMTLRECAEKMGMSIEGARYYKVSGINMIKDYINDF